MSEAFPARITYDEFITLVDAARILNERAWSFALDATTFDAVIAASVATARAARLLGDRGLAMTADTVEPGVGSWRKQAP